MSLLVEFTTSILGLHCMSGLMVSNAVARLRYIIKNLLVPPIDTSKVGQKLKLIVISNLPVFYVVLIWLIYKFTAEQNNIQTESLDALCYASSLILHFYVSNSMLQVCGCDPSVNRQGRGFRQWWHLVPCGAVRNKQRGFTSKGAASYIICSFLSVVWQRIFHITYVCIHFCILPALCSFESQRVPW